MLDALYLGSHNWISLAPIVSIPLYYFPPIQELLLILRRKVACFVDSLFRRLSSPIFQVSLVFIAGTLDSSCQHVSSDRNVGGCFFGHAKTGWGGGGGGGGGGGFLGPVGSCAFSPFYQFGITTWN